MLDGIDRYVAVRVALRSAAFLQLLLVAALRSFARPARALFAPVFAARLRARPVPAIHRHAREPDASSGRSRNLGNLPALGRRRTFPPARRRLSRPRPGFPDRMRLDRMNPLMDSAAYAGKGVYFFRLSKSV